jgi:MoaA/NifB/PqqE/SkfB family radical SAM enzyme
MSQIVEIRPIKDIFSITWELTSHCNYACSYCPPELHNKLGEFHSFETLKSSWLHIYDQIKILDLPIKITFTGGEISTVKDFLPFVIWLRENFKNFDSILIISNGSASFNFYEKLSKHVEAITFSTHSEFFNSEKFFETAIMLNQIMIRPEKSFHVNVMDEPWNKEQIITYKEILDKHSISYSINEINFRNNVEEITPSSSIKNLQNHINYNCQATTNDGSTFLLHANTLHNDKLDFWKGWKCAAGRLRIHIDSKLKVYSGVCRNDELGLVEDFQLLPFYTTCNRIRCTGCTDDLIIQKYK